MKISNVTITINYDDNSYTVLYSSGRVQSIYDGKTHERIDDAALQLRLLNHVTPFLVAGLRCQCDRH